MLRLPWEEAERAMREWAVEHVHHRRGRASGPLGKGAARRKSVRRGPHRAREALRGISGTTTRVVTIDAVAPPRAIDGCNDTNGVHINTPR